MFQLSFQEMERKYQELEEKLNKNKEDTLAVDIGYSVEKQDKSAKKHSLSKKVECDDEDEREEFVAQKRRKLAADSIAAPQDANGMEACFDLPFSIRLSLPGVNICLHILGRPRER